MQGGYGRFEPTDDPGQRVTADNGGSLVEGGDESRAIVVNSTNGVLQRRLTDLQFAAESDV